MVAQASETQPPAPTVALSAARGSEGSLGLRHQGIVYVDGRFCAPDEAGISVFDHGLLYGDGVFEGIRIYNGRIFKLERHVERMFRSASRIGLDPGVSPSEMCGIVLETAARSGLREGYLRPIFTRGEGDLGVDPRTAFRPTVIVICSTINPYHGKSESGVRLIVSSVRRNPPETLDPNIKSLNYLNNVLAKAESNARRADDALLLDLHGHVAEATGENVFVVREGRLYSPPTTTNLEGITRETIVELAAGILPFEEREFDVAFLTSSQEAFLTGTGAEVLPIVAVDGTSVGDGSPGPMTRRLQRAYFDLVRSSGTPIPYT